MLRNRKIIALAPLLLCFAFAGEKIAIITKIIGKAEYVRNDKLPKNLKRGFIIESGDEISTKKGAFVALVFIDDRSALKIREKSQIVINGKKNARIINKKINLNNGTIRAQNYFVFNVPQSGGDFQSTDSDTIFGNGGTTQVVYIP